MSERKLASNAVFYSGALAIQKALSFVYFIIIARGLGVVDQGRFTFALSFTSIFAMFLDLGLTQVLIRETAKNQENSEKYLGNIITLKIIGSAIIYSLVIFIINLMGYPEATKNLVYVSGLVMLLDSFSLSIYGSIRGHQNMTFESMGTVFNQLAVLAVGGILVWLGFSPVAVMAAYVVGSLFNFLWSSFNLRRQFGVKIKLNFDWKMIAMLLVMAWPFALAGIFNRVFSSIDVVMLSKLSGDHAVGIYSVAFKVAFALQFVALAFSAVIYPAFSNYYVHAKDKLSDLFTKSMHWLAFLAMPLTFGVISISDKVIVPVFGHQYSESIIPLNILMLALLFVFLCFPIGAMLNACDRQSRNTIHLGIVAGFSFLANLILIPIWGYNGSAVANLMSYFLLFILGISVVGSIVKYDKKFLAFSFMKSLLACLLMSGAVLVVKNYTHFIIAIVTGALVYFAGAYALGLFRLQSVKELLRDIRK